MFDGVADPSFDLGSLRGESIRRRVESENMPGLRTDFGHQQDVAIVGPDIFLKDAEILLVHPETESEVDGRAQSVSSQYVVVAFDHLQPRVVNRDLVPREND